MSDSRGYRGQNAAVSVEPSRLIRASRATAPVVSVEVTDPLRFSHMRAEWSDLLKRAAAHNVFMDPALVRATAENDPAAKICVLLAWTVLNGARRLAGTWSFAVGSSPKSALPLSVLNAPPSPYAWLATPVIDDTCIVEVLEAMLDRIANDPALPKTVALEGIGTDNAVMEALTRVLVDRESAPSIFGLTCRPKLQSGHDGKTYLENAVSSSTRKKLRQHRRRLSEKGELTSRISLDPASVSRALDDFLTIEAAGWKGRQGTAVLCDERDAAFVRVGMSALAEQGCASVHGLYLDGQAVSLQIVLRSGPAAFTWKTTYDERFQDFSPGMLLLEDYTTAFLAEPSIEFVDSCAHDDTGFMSAWTERQTISDLWFDARRGGSLAFRVLSSLERSYRGLRAAAKDSYLTVRRLRTRLR